MKTNNAHLNISKTPSQFVAVNILIAVGSRNETAEINGISHIIEHLIYEHVTSGDTDIIRKPWLETMYATTHKNRTEFEFEVPKKNQVEIAQIVKKIINFTSISQETLQKELEVIYEELIEAEEDQDYELYRKEARWCYEESSMSLPIGGTTKAIKKITPAQVKSYIKKYYTPQNIIVSIVGDVEDTGLRTQLKELDIPVQTTDFMSPPELVLSNQTKSLSLEKKSQQIEFSESRFAQLSGLEEVIRFEFFANTLYYYLFRKLREDAGIYDTSVNQFMFTDITELNVFIKYKNDKHDQVMEMYELALKDFSKISSPNLENAKQLFLIEREKDDQNLQMKAHYQSWYSAVFGSEYSLQKVKKIISEIQPSDIAVFCKTFSLGQQGQRTTIGAVSSL